MSWVTVRRTTVFRQPLDTPTPEDPVDQDPVTFDAGSNDVTVRMTTPNSEKSWTLTTGEKVAIEVGEAEPAPVEGTPRTMEDL
jgi:hypothetical protein